MFSDVQSAFFSTPGDSSAYERVPISTIPSYCRFRGMYLGYNSSTVSDRIDFLLEDDGKDDEVPDDDDVVFVSAAGALGGASNILIPDDSYVQLTDKLYVTCETEGVLLALKITIFYTV